uniref:Putative secreted papa repeat protein n=1 Tax=Ixodes ricinus TaxID=34613 RepID=A0A131Y559_IXORI
MRAALSVLLLVAVCLVLVDSAYGRRRHPAEEKNNENCERVSPQRQNLLRCKYFCKGWPFRRVNEADGTVCMTTKRKEGRCVNGGCVTNKRKWRTKQPGTRSTWTTPGARWETSEPSVPSTGV